MPTISEKDLESTIECALLAGGPDACPGGENGAAATAGRRRGPGRQRAGQPPRQGAPDLRPRRQRPHLGHGGRQFQVLQSAE